MENFWGNHHREMARRGVLGGGSPYLERELRPKDLKFVCDARRAITQYALHDCYAPATRLLHIFRHRTSGLPADGPGWGVGYR